MEKDLEILKKILKGLNFSEDYITVLIKYLVDKLQDFQLNDFTPPFLKVQLSPEIGKNLASEVAEYFDEMKSTGDYKTKLQKLLDKSPYLK